MLVRDLSVAEIRDLVQRTHTASDIRGIERRAEFSARYLAMRGKCDELVKERIRQTFQTPHISMQVQKHASHIFNPIHTLSKRIAKAYSNPPIRQLVDRSDDENRAYLRVLENLSFNGKAREWNRWQVAMNTVAVMVRPCVDTHGDPSLDFFRVTGAASEVVLDPDRAFADAPAILAYCIFPDARARGHLADYGAEFVCLVDAESYYYFDRSGRLTREVHHGLGRFPGAILRATDPEHGDGNDWWDPDTGRSVTEALRVAGMQGAILSWSRKSMFGKLISLERANQSDYTGASQPESEGGQIIGNPEGPVIVEPGATINVQDMTVGIKEFREHMGMILAEAVRNSTGTASMLEDPSAGAATNDIAEVAKHAALRQIQNEQIEYLRPFEREIAEVMSGFAEQTGMQGLPSADVMREAFDVEFRPLTFLDTPESRLRHYVEATSFGVADQVSYMQEQGYSEQEAIAELHKIAERRAALHEIQATRQTPADPMDGSTLESNPAAPGEPPAAQTGRYGGRARPALVRATDG